jgi:Rieske Fe-S protein
MAIQESPDTSRRKFTQLLTMTGLAALAAGAVVYLRSRPKTYPQRVVAQAGDIPVGGFKIFTYPTDVEPCILLRPADETYIAFSRICTHASCPVHYRQEENRLDCPCHQGSFSASDGSVLFGPPPRPLPRVILERRGTDLVAVGMMNSQVAHRMS